jgi:hypothetical protein
LINITHFYSSNPGNVVGYHEDNAMHHEDIARYSLGRILRRLTMLKQFGFGILATLVTVGSVIAPASAQPKQPKPTVTPAPEAQFIPKTRVELKGDRVNVMLINKTNAAISYQAVGDTQIRTLPGRGTVMLQGLRVPTTLTLDRQDFGLLQVTPKQSEKSPGTIEVTLDTNTNLATDGTTMRVEENGSVFLY